MKNKILVTGLGIGRDLGFSQVCNYDLSWLVYCPSNLLWSDEILVDSSFQDMVKMRSMDKQDKSINFLFDLLESFGFIKKYDITKYIDTVLKEMIKEQVDQDIDYLSKSEPSFRIKDDHFICVSDSEYCYPNIYSMYITVILSRLLDASCLYDAKTKQFLTEKLNLCTGKVRETEKVKVMHDLYSIFLPNPSLLPEYFFTDESKCVTCAREAGCKDNYLKQIENNVSSIFELRTRDELFQFREFIEKHLSKKYDIDITGPDLSDIKNDIDKEIRKIKTRIRKVFPHYKRLINLVSFLTIPVSIPGAFISNSVLTTVPLVSAGVVQSLRLLMENYSSKNNWVAFYNK